MNQPNEQKTSAWIVDTRKQVSAMLARADAQQAHIPAQLYVDVSTMMRRVEWLIKLQGRDLKTVKGYDHTEAAAIFRILLDALDADPYDV